MATESPETSIYQGPAFPFPPPAPCEGFLCYYEAGNNYFTSSMIWKLLISLSIILMILIIVASVIICTNCGCGKKKKRRNSRLEELEPLD
ncbi:unnamed protein product, partial [Mesorhabditis belari]|uniref:Uncharacterized protein n=1 Tax=Mesorhabditis belari TaxID=2138241 RepID=A0AAF3FQW6_9BILA